MKKAKILITIVCVVLMQINTTVSYGYESFNISQSIEPNSRNFLGLAVEPQNGHVFISSTSYGGADNLHEFDSNGDLISSSRAAFETGTGGNLGSMVVGMDGNLIVYACYYDGNVTPTTRYILEMSQDGQTVFSSLSNTDARSGISYSPQTDNLFYLDYLSPQQYQINEITTTGTLVNQFQIEEPMVSSHYQGLAYDPISEDLYINELYAYANILNQYSKNELGEYVYVMSYDMKSLPLSGMVFDIDINRSNGLFYAQFNNSDVVIFDLDELDSFYIPEPTSLSLLALGGLVLRKRKA